VGVTTVTRVRAHSSWFCWRLSFGLQQCAVQFAGSGNKKEPSSLRSVDLTYTRILLVVDPTASSSHDKNICNLLGLPCGWEQLAEQETIEAK